MRNGQAGFFSDEELSKSDGVLWDAADDVPREGARRDEPPRVTQKRSFDREDLDAFRQGHAYSCFGTGFEMAAAHTRTPTLPSGQLRLIDEVAEFDPEGGPWGRGYLRATAAVPTDAWFYDGHFKNDPCMPGTLMADAATQALSFAMAAYGFTIERDGWRFEPVPDEMARFVCRGQVTPDADHILDYEVFVEEIIDGPTPTIFAALLCTQRRFQGVPLPSVRDAPGSGLADAAGCASSVRRESSRAPRTFAAITARCWPARVACRPMRSARCTPRSTAPVAHRDCPTSRTTSCRASSVSTSPPGVPTKDGTVVAEYDVPADAWYFADDDVRCRPVVGADRDPAAAVRLALLLHRIRRQSRR